MTSIKKLLAALVVTAFLATSAGAFAQEAANTTATDTKPAAEKTEKTVKKVKKAKKHKKKKKAAAAAAPAADAPATTAPATNQ